MNRLTSLISWRLELPAELRIHDVFHVEELALVHDSMIEGQPEYPLGLVEADVAEDAEREWDVAAILDSKVLRTTPFFKYQVC